MVKIDHLENSHQTNQTLSETKPTETQGSEKSPSKLITTLGSLLPFAPLVFEQFTGQKVPQLSGTMFEIQNGIQQLQLTNTQILNNQQQIWTRLENLEKSASQQFTNLTQQFQSLRLTHTKERKEIEYNPPKLENQDY